MGIMKGIMSLIIVSLVLVARTEAFKSCSIEETILVFWLVFIETWAKKTCKKPYRIIANVSVSSLLLACWEMRFSAIKRPQIGSVQLQIRKVSTASSCSSGSAEYLDWWCRRRPSNRARYKSRKYLTLFSAHWECTTCATCLPHWNNNLWILCLDNSQILLAGDDHNHRTSGRHARYYLAYTQKKKKIEKYWR